MNVKTVLGITVIPSLICIVVLVPGCLIGSSSRTDYSGSYVSPQTLEKIAPGATAEEVTSLIGDPTSKNKTAAGGDIWKWEYRTETTSEGSVFLLFSSSKTTESKNSVYVEFREGVVTRTWRD